MEIPTIMNTAHGAASISRLLEKQAWRIGVLLTVVSACDIVELDSTSLSSRMAGAV